MSIPIGYKFIKIDGFYFSIADGLNWVLGLRQCKGEQDRRVIRNTRISYNYIVNHSVIRARNDKVQGVTSSVSWALCILS